MEVEIPPLCSKTVTKYTSNSQTPVYFFDGSDAKHSPYPNETMRSLDTVSLGKREAHYQPQNPFRHFQTF